MALYELVVELEERLEVALPDEAIADVQTVADLWDVVERGRDGQLDGEGIGAAAVRLREELPGVARTVERQDGRMVLIEDRWFADFASCNYLGLDLHPAIQASIPPLVAEWGVHPSWTRAVASPAPYRELEGELAALLGVDDVVVFPTITLLHFGVLPRLVGSRGVILLDGAVHQSVQEAAALARGGGTTTQTWRSSDLEHLEALLRGAGRFGRRVIAVDGVFSMSGETADLPALVTLAQQYDATVYVDDAHGLGILGDGPSVEEPYGRGGRGVVRWYGGGYERIVYVAGMSKAFSSMAAFVTCTGGVDRGLCESASTMVFSGPVPVASLASSLAAIAINHREGDELRSSVLDRSRQLIDGLDGLGFEVDSGNAFPIVNVVIGGPQRVIDAAHRLWRAGVLCTPSVFPAMALGRGGLRFTVTAANTTAQVDRVLEAMAGVPRGARPERDGMPGARRRG
jgi:7-keto-8-aminopelargonate synthetase-like enzyme